MMILFYHNWYIFPPNLYLGTKSALSGLVIALHLVARCGDCGAIFSGFMIDRFSAHKIAGPSQIFLLGSCLLLYFADNSVMLGMFLLLWCVWRGDATCYQCVARIRYGTQWLGEIKSLASPLNVFSSALSSVVMGIMFDIGFGLNGIVILLGALACLNVIMPLIWFNFVGRTTYHP